MDTLKPSINCNNEALVSHMLRWHVCNMFQDSVYGDSSMLLGILPDLIRNTDNNTNVDQDIYNSGCFSVVNTFTYLNMRYGFIYVLIDDISRLFIRNDLYECMFAAYSTRINMNSDNGLITTSLMSHEFGSCKVINYDFNKIRSIFMHGDGIYKNVNRTKIALKKLFVDDKI